MKNTLITIALALLAFSCAAQSADTTYTSDAMIIKRTIIERHSGVFFEVKYTRIEYPGGRYIDESIGNPIGKAHEVVAAIESELAPDSTASVALERQLIANKVKRIIARRIARYIRDNGKPPLQSDILIWEKEELDKINNKSGVIDTTLSTKQAPAPPTTKKRKVR